MKGNEVRRIFIDYFKKKGHQAVPSSSLVPENDSTLLFTNAGMNQFKNIFLGKEKRPYSRATSCQKCVRAGGKHNDLENVGRTARHHTFFEMLGNFSFGDYFKEEAIEYAWELITRVYGINDSRLYATVYKDDEEAFQLWKKIAGLPENRILRLGEKDNFWAMGDTGPCGPCSEILYDLRVSPQGHINCKPDCECGRYLEIWNLVFMQYNRDLEGDLKPLPSPSIDTGMGLERITSVLQGQLSNYDTDFFIPLINEMAEIAGYEYGENSQYDVSLRVISDHVRAGAFLISDGVLPSNEGRGYVLRKILRRAIRHGKILGVEDAFLYKLSGTVVEMMGDVYSELIPAREYISKVIKIEEEKFSSTIEFGLKKLFSMVGKESSSPVVIDGSKIFKLYDTYGFPIDILEDIAREKGWMLDLDGFNIELQKQKERARASWRGEAQQTVDVIYRDLASMYKTIFVGYEKLSIDKCKVFSIISNKRSVQSLNEGEEGEVLLDKTPFYAESGGQVGDQGFLRSGETSARVIDTFSPVQGLIVHKVKILKGTLNVGMEVIAHVDGKRRFATACNHTATHLLHAALRETLGNHVKQAGSLVSPNRLRFDFTHFTRVSDKEIEIIEEIINEQIRSNKEVKTDILPIEDAVKAGAMALFGEKYSDLVRVVSIEGFSKELCGGTHLARTGQMGIFKIVSESSIASGVRRIEAVTAEEAYHRFSVDEKIIMDVTRKYHIERENLLIWLEDILSSMRRSQKQIEKLRLKMASFELKTIFSNKIEVNGISIMQGIIENVDRQMMRTLALRGIEKYSPAIVAIGSEIEGRAAIVVAVSDEISKKYPAGKIISPLAEKIGGKGGGKPTLAEAGGKEPSKLHPALKELRKIVAVISK